MAFSKDFESEIQLVSSYGNSKASVLPLGIGKRRSSRRAGAQLSENQVFLSFASLSSQGGELQGRGIV